MASSDAAARGTPTEYPGTIHRKVKGTLILTDSDLTFRPEGSSTNGSKEADASLTIPWSAVEKHQVSPATHPKHLLRVLLQQSVATGASDDNGRKKKAPAKAFELSSRLDLDRVRKDVTSRLQKAAAAATNRKRKRSTDDGDGDDALQSSPAQYSSPSYTDLEPSTIAVARSSLLSSSPTLRSQHDHLVTQTQTLSEESFWSHHAQSVADEAARIHGRLSAGQSSTIKSNLDLGPRGRVRLGVEEMRQIFVMYPAVHAAYEEKVPLELSEEQFWRRYLESEFFHRDRGRIGAHISKTVEGGTGAGAGAAGGEGKKDDGGDEGKTLMDKKKSAKEDEAARAARLGAAGANDLFSRAEAEQSQHGSGPSATTGGARTTKKRPKVGGQFDLAATAASDRGDRVLNATDLFPQDTGAAGGGGSGDGTTARVIDKYNRHSRLVVRHSDDPGSAAVDDDGVDEENEPGTDAEMRRLVGFADATEDSADHVHGTEDGIYEELFLRNVGAYSGNMGNGDTAAAGGANPSTAEEMKKRGVLSKAVAASTREMATQMLRADGGNNGDNGKSTTLEGSFPPASLGKELLSALTKRMAQNSSADTDATAITNQMPTEFRDKLNSYFRRSSELLRHFFGIRDSLDPNMGGGCSEADLRKLNKIVKGMEKIYREMEAMRKSLPQSKLGEAMRKMCVPIMDQLDLAFKLHRENASGRSGGGFVTVEEL